MSQFKSFCFVINLHLVSLLELKSTRYMCQKTVWKFSKIRYPITNFSAPYFWIVLKQICNFFPYPDLQKWQDQFHFDCNYKALWLIPTWLNWWTGPLSMCYARLCLFHILPGQCELTPPNGEKNFKQQVLFFS